jgi:hypothetical protein
MLFVSETYQNYPNDIMSEECVGGDSELVDMRQGEGVQRYSVHPHSIIVSPHTVCKLTNPENEKYKYDVFYTSH